MNSYFNQGNNDEQLLLKLSQKKNNNSKVSIEKSRKRISSAKVTLGDLKCDGL